MLERRLLRSDISRKTPYNTYQIKALPPTPIANPGYAAIEAVLNPLDTKDLYFVADGTGGHAFATTLAEHNRNVAKWRKIEAKRRSLAASKAALARKESAAGESAGDQVQGAAAADSAEAGASKTATPAPPPAPPAPPSVESTAPAETGSTAGSSSVAASSVQSPSSQRSVSPPKPEAQAPETSSVPVAAASQQAAAIPADPSSVDAGTRPAARAFPIPIPRPKPLRPKSPSGAVTNSEPDAGAKPVASESRASAPVTITPPAAKRVRKIKPASKSRVKIIEPDR